MTSAVGFFVLVTSTIKWLPLLFSKNTSKINKKCSQKKALFTIFQHKNLCTSFLRLARCQRKLPCQPPAGCGSLHRALSVVTGIHFPCSWPRIVLIMETARRNLTLHSASIPPTSRGTAWPWTPQRILELIGWLEIQSWFNLTLIFLNNIFFLDYTHLLALYGPANNLFDFYDRFR